MGRETRVRRMSDGYPSAVKGGGGGSKSWRKPGAQSRRMKRIRHHNRLLIKKDARVVASSHGAFSGVAALEAHRHNVAPGLENGVPITVSR